MFQKKKYHRPESQKLVLSNSQKLLLNVAGMFFSGFMLWSANHIDETRGSREMARIVWMLLAIVYSVKAISSIVKMVRDGK